jgi:hypothetical protein
VEAGDSGWVFDGLYGRDREGVQGKSRHSAVHLELCFQYNRISGVGCGEDKQKR